MFYSASKGGFYSREIHGDNMPEDVIDITDDEYAALLSGQSDGKTIAPDASGFPILVDPPSPGAEDVVTSINARREEAYRSESDPAFFKYQRGEATKEEWLASVDAIRARYPK